MLLRKLLNVKRVCTILSEGKHIYTEIVNLSEEVISGFIRISNMNQNRKIIFKYKKITVM